MTKTIGAAALTLYLGALAAPSQAAVYDWRISGAFTGSGRLTTTDPSFTYGDLEEPISGQAGPGFLVTAMTGRFANRDVSLVAADPDTGPFFASNLLYPAGSRPFLDDRGLIFRTSVRTYALFGMEICGGNRNGGDTNRCITVPAIGYPGISGGGSREVTFTITAVPEPAVWAMMLIGFGMVGGATRYRRRRAIGNAWAE